MTVHVNWHFTMEDWLDKVDNHKLRFSVFSLKNCFSTYFFRLEGFCRSDVSDLNACLMKVQKNLRRSRFFGDFLSKFYEKIHLSDFRKKRFSAVEILNLLPIDKFCIFKNIGPSGKYFPRALCFSIFDLCIFYAN